MTTFFRGSLILGREVARGSHVQGGDRRPEPEFHVDPVEIARWNHVQEVTRRAYATRMAHLDERAVKDARNEAAAK